MLREINYVLSKSDYREIYVTSCVRRLWRFGLICGPLLTGLNIWTAYCRCGYITTDEILDGALWGFGIALAACLAVLLLNAWSGGRIHDAMEPIAKGLTISWDDEALRLKSDFYAAAYPWPLFKQSRESKRVIAAYVTAMSPLLVPKRALSEEELAEFRKHLLSAKSS